MALSLVPASSALFRDMTGIRTEHPQWIAENCTACGKCAADAPEHVDPVKRYLSYEKAYLDGELADLIFGL